MDNFEKHAIEFKETMLTHWEAALFIRDNKLWVGFWKYGWVSRLLIIAAFLLGLKLWGVLAQWWNKADVSDVAHTFASMGMLARDVASESYNFLFTGGLKYVILILLEVIIFHICRRTLEIISGKAGELTFKDFYKAQIRMIKIVIRCYIMEMIITILLKIGFGILGPLEFLEPVAIFTVQCYFLGVVVIDNYNEQFGLSIKDSFNYVKQFIGVALAIGLVMNLLLMVPVVGSIIGPVLAAVTATLVMFRLSDLHLPQIPVIPAVEPGLQSS